MKSPRRRRIDGAPSSSDLNDPRLHWYPQPWRERYGPELTALLDDEYPDHLPLRIRLDLAISGLRQRARYAGITSGVVAPADQLRSAALVVMAAWTAFVVAGASFAKFSEHFDQALPHRGSAHSVPDFSYAVLQSVAGGASILVIAGALLAAPSFLRYVQAGGWTYVRRHFWRAISVTLVTIATTVPLVVIANHLSVVQRNTDWHWYGVLFFVWAALIAVTLSSWTIAGIATTRRLVLSPRMLHLEAMLAATVALAMVVMLAATTIWWVAMAKDAPNFLGADPGGAPSSSWDIWLVSIVVTMVLATGVGVAGALREWRVWSTSRVAS